jgi:hypothetical protein
VRCFSIRVIYKDWQTRQRGDGVSESSYCECVRAANRLEAINRVMELEHKDNPGRSVDRIVVNPRGTHVCSARD